MRSGDEKVSSLTLIEDLQFKRIAPREKLPAVVEKDSNPFVEDEAVGGIGFPLLSPMLHSKDEIRFSSRLLGERGRTRLGSR
jgi:hypothetical protein